MQMVTGPEYESVKRTLLKNLTFTIMDITYHSEHMHHDMEIVQVLSGSLHVKTARESYDLADGDVALFSMNVIHSFWSDLVSPATVLVIHVNPAFCAEYFPDILHIRFKVSRLADAMIPQAFAEVKRTCFNLGYNYFGERPAYQFRCLSDLYRLIGIFVGELPYDLASEETLATDTKQLERITRVLNYMHIHFRERLTLGELAEKENLSTTYLSHLFKDMLHTSFQSYLNQLRFEHALLLVQTTDWKLIDICNESGFSDSKYLNKTFMQIFQMTPKDYRQHFTQCDHKNVHPMGIPEENDRQLLIYSQSESIAILRAHHQYHCDTNIKINSIIDPD